MMLVPQKKQLIAIEVIRTLKSRFESFPEDSTGNRNAPFHKAFLNAFSDRLIGRVESVPDFISLASWMHGLNTTLGQAFFEKVAHILCDGEKKEYKTLRISAHQQTTISNIITELKNNTRSPNLTTEDVLIFDVRGAIEIATHNFTADVYYEDNDEIVAIELKTVKPNSSVFRAEKEKILLSKAALKNAFPSKNVKFYLGFPFDPLSITPTGHEKTAFMRNSVDFNKFFYSEEVLLAGELWDFLSGEEDTMQQILDIINIIATPQFMENYDFINDIHNLAGNQTRYIAIIDRWSLYDERKIVDNIEPLRRNASLSRFVYQSMFKNDGKYNIERSRKLLGSIA